MTDPTRIETAEQALEAAFAVLDGVELPFGIHTELHALRSRLAPAPPAALIAEAVERIIGEFQRPVFVNAGSRVRIENELRAAEARGFERGKASAAEDGELRAAIHDWHFGPNYISAEQRLVEIAERNDAAMRAADGEEGKYPGAPK